MKNYVNQKLTLKMAKQKAKNYANALQTPYCIFVYNEKAGDFKGHHLVEPEYIRQLFDKNKELDFVEKVEVGIKIHS